MARECALRRSLRAAGAWTRRGGDAMAHKKVLFRSEARERLLRGVATLTDAVRVTLGPRSKSVLIEKRYGSPIVCNDGVTIAKEMELEDRGGKLGGHKNRRAAEPPGGGGRGRGGGSRPQPGHHPGACDVRRRRGERVGPEVRHRVLELHLL